MANDSYYLDKNKFKIAWLGPESAFRTNAQGKDTANLVGDTFFRLPGRLLTVPYLYKKQNKIYTRLANNKGWSYFAHHGYAEGRIDLTLEMIDLSMMHYLVKSCTTTDDSPSAGKYTHVSVSTTTHTTPPPSFQMLIEYGNDEAGNTITTLLTGCTLYSAPVISGSSEQNIIQLQLQINFANSIAGNSLTSWPGFGTLKAYTFDRTSVVLAKGGTTYPGKARGFSIQYDDGTFQPKCANEELPEEAINGNPDIQVSVDWAPKDNTLLDDTINSPLEPETASDVDLTIKMYRDATTDYTEFAFEKIWNVSADADYTFPVRRIFALSNATTYVIKSAEFETGAKLTITEVNALDDDRYET